MELVFGTGEISFSKEAKIYISSNKNKAFDFLIFFDSRGLTVNEVTVNDTSANKVKEYLSKQNKTYIFVSRPKNLTVFSTLYNFLLLNPSLKFGSLITNLGFVDCTPKKEDAIIDIKKQIYENMNLEVSCRFHEEYLLSNGRAEVLQTLIFTSQYTQKISFLLNQVFENLYFINTPEVNEKIRIERERPKLFFSQLQETNSLIDIIIKGIDKPTVLIDIVDVNHTYDGVHLDKEGHKIVFNKLKESIHI